MRSFRDFIACSACHRDYLVQSPPSSDTNAPAVPPSVPLAFYVTTCHHTLCHTCLFSTNPAPHPLDQVRIPCSACQSITPLALLVLDNPTDELAPFFADQAELANTAMMTGQFQLGNLMEQIAYLKPKCVQQKKSISRLLNEVKKTKAYKSENEQLRSEVASLREELSRGVSSRPPFEVQQDQQGQYWDPSAQDHREYLQEPPMARSAGRHHVDDEHAPKRRAVNAVERAHGHRSAYSSSDSQQDRESSYDQLRPARLTLTPASRASHHLHHWTQALPPMQEEGSFPPIEGIKSSKVIHFAGNGENRRSESARGGRFDGRPDPQGAEGFREHLSSYVYVPSASRASQRPPSTLAQPIPRPHTVAADSFASSLRSHDPQERPFAQLDSYDPGSRSRDAAEDRRAMPPPPLPMSSRPRPFVPRPSAHATPRSTPSIPDQAHESLPQARAQTPQSQSAAHRVV